MRRGHEGGRVLCCRRLRGQGVAFCQTGVGVRRLRGAVHPGGGHSVLVVAPGDLTQRVMDINKAATINPLLIDYLRNR